MACLQHQDWTKQDADVLSIRFDSARVPYTIFNSIQGKVVRERERALREK